jgi:integrase
VKGCRPLTQDEVGRILDALKGSRLALRNRCLVQVGIYTGFRISELLSLRVGDVLRDGRVLARVRVERKHMKGKRSSRDVPLNLRARAALAEWLPVLFAWRDNGPDLYLFQSAKGGRLSRRQAGRILARLAGALRLGPGIGTHSLRKTFAQAVYDRALSQWRPGQELPVRVAMKALGHSSVEVTEHYLGLDVQAVDDAVMALKFGEAV